MKLMISSALGGATLAMVLAGSLVVPATAGRSLPGDYWFEGSVEEAFERSRTEGKPVLLYWGAVWCPPCNEIKRAVFADRRFPELLGDGLAVYLDGDTPRAQKWGDRFRFSGYPTVLLIDPKGREIMRIGYGVDFPEFETAYTAAMASGRPFQETLERALSGQADESDWRTLSYFSWAQARLEGSPAEILEKRRQVVTKVPSDLHVEAALLSAALLYAASEDGEDPGLDAVRDRVKAEASTHLERMFHSSATERAIRMSLNEDAGNILGWIRVLPPDPETVGRFRAWKTRWLEAVGRLGADPELTPNTRMWTAYPALELHRVERSDGPFPGPLKDAVRAATRRALAEATSYYDRHAVVSNAAYLLRVIEDYDEGRKVLLAEIDRTDTPWYYLSSLSTLERKAGDLEKALEYSRRAKEVAQGPATRLQWIVNDIQLLAKHTPKEKPEILLERLGEYYDHALDLPDGFQGRNGLRARKVEVALKPWLTVPAIRQLIDRRAATCAEDSPVGCADHFAAFSTPPAGE